MHHPIRIPMEDDLVHTGDSPFCADPTCPDKEDPDLLAAVAQQVEDGLLTPDEATRFVQGRQL
ncbi:MAG: hypothetical protein ACRDIV_19365 [Ktedonobacteraceae bacterium]